MLLDAAARLDDVALALVQIMLSLFGIIAFSIDGFAHAAEALVGEAIGRHGHAEQGGGAHQPIGGRDGRFVEPNNLVW